MKKKILVIGGSGLVGSRIIQLLSDKFDFLSPDHKKLDITDINSVEKYLRKNSDIDSIINLAAFTDVNKAEEQRGFKKESAWVLNVEGAKNVAIKAHEYGKYLVHISTDFIFPGTSSDPGPYAEDAKLSHFRDGISWYGWTKLEGERAVQRSSKNFAIVRIAYPFRVSYELKGDFARNIIDLYKNKKLYPMFSDQILTPTYIDELAGAIPVVFEKKPQGVLHIISSDTTTPYDFADYLLEKLFSVKGAVEKGSMRKFLHSKGATPRPRLGGLTNKKTQKILGIKFNSWKKSVDGFVEQYKAKG